MRDQFSLVTVMINKEAVIGMKHTQLEILKEFDRVCRKCNIPYHLTGGSLLGAVRHQGFIPWDDDIDVAMYRDDYEYFLHVSKSEISDKYFIQNCKTEKNYYLFFSKIRKNNTLALQDIVSNLDIHHGIFIDVFPLDKVPSTVFLRNIVFYSFWIVENLKALKLKQRAFRSRNIYLKLIKISLHYLVKYIPFKIFDSLLKTIALIARNSPSNLYTMLVETDLNTYKSYIHNKVMLSDLIEAEFEGEHYFIPKQYDLLLSNIFGDYMALPAIKDRKSHHGFINIKF